MPESNQALTPHEAVQLHELLSMKVMEIKKLKTSGSKVSDDSNLVEFIDNTIKTKQQHLGEFEQFINGNVLQ